jgi:hypothetical protein
VKKVVPNPLEIVRRGQDSAPKSGSLDCLALFVE